MPVIPQYDANQVRPTALPNVQVDTSMPLEAAGGGASAAAVTNAAQGLVQSTQNIFLEEQKKADDAVTQDAYTQALKFKQDYLFNDKTGALNRRGKNALEHGAADQEAFDKEMARISEGLRNPVQRQMFDRIKRQVGSDFNESLQRHAFTESRTLRAETSKASQGVTKQEIIYNAADAMKTRENIAMLEGLVRSDPTLEGQAPETIAAAVQAAKSEAYLKSIAQLVDNGNLGRAREVRAEAMTSPSGLPGLTADDLNKADDILRVGTVDAEGQARAKAIIDKHPTDFQAQLAELDKIKDIKIQDEARRRLHARNVEIESAKKATREANIEQAAKYLLGAKTDVGPQRLNAWDAVPASIRAQMLPADFDAVDAIVNPPPKTDVGTYGYLQDLAAKDPDKFMKVNLREYYKYLAPADRKFFDNWQIKIGERDQKVMMEISKAKADKDSLSSVARELGMNPDAKKNSGAWKIYEEFNDAATQAVRDEGQKLKRELTTDEQEDVFRRVAQKVEIPGAVYGVNAVPLFRVRRQDLSPEEVRRIAGLLQKAGQPVNDVNIMKAYRALKMRSK